MTTEEEIPIFPLHTVLFPGGLLPLRIFEARYLDMVSSCLQTNTGFGVCLIRTGKEVGDPASHYQVGTYARIIDWDQNETGLLAVTVAGERRFKVVSTSVQPDNLTLGRINWLAEPESMPLPETYKPLQAVLLRISKALNLRYDKDPEKLGDVVWLGSRLAELLPMDLGQKQLLLESNDGLKRLKSIQTIVERLNSDDEIGSN